MIETLFVVLVLAAFIAIIIDTSAGMFYGTLLSPILVGAGWSPLLVIPSILFSQMIGDLSGVIIHAKLKNAVFNGLTRDMKISIAMIVPGCLAAIVGAIYVFSVPKFALQLTIALVTITMSLLCLRKIQYAFRWTVHCFYSAVAGFLKFSSGGGFGPITSTGGILGGIEAKVSVATTSLAELVICAFSFSIYYMYNGMPELWFVSALTIGAFIGGFIGPYIASRTDQTKLRRYVAYAGLIAGTFCLLSIVFGWSIKI